MIRRTALALLCALLLAAPAFSRAEAAEPATAQPDGGDAQAALEMPKVSAEGAALFESGSMRFVAGVNEHAALPMASTTKVMTALLAIECGDLDALVKVPDCAVGVEGSSIYLNRGEQLTLRDLLHGLMLTSGNEAAVTIAVYLDGSVEAFAAHMNARAAEIGCLDTCFVNPNGLPNDAHHTTAYDLCRIAATAMQNETFRALVSTTYYKTTSGDYVRTFKNKNRILWQYEGGNGVKTGYTKAAGHCLVFSAERDGMTLVGVVLHAPGRWDDSMALLDYGFDRLRVKTLVSANTPLIDIPVTNAEKKELAAYAKGDILYPMATDGSDTISWEFEADDSIDAPVVAGQEVGHIRLFVNGEAVVTMPLVVREDVARYGWLDALWRVLEDWVA